MTHYSPVPPAGAAYPGQWISQTLPNPQLMHAPHQVFSGGFVVNEPSMSQQPPLYYDAPVELNRKRSRGMEKEDESPSRSRDIVGLQAQPGFQLIQPHPHSHPLPQYPGSGATGPPQWHTGPHSQYELAHPQSGPSRYWEGEPLPQHVPGRGGHRDKPGKVCMVGKPGYPPPAPNRGDRARFAPEDDELLKSLKEQHQELSWLQIADFFPGRKAGTLQVRYCTKLKTRDDVQWDKDKVSIFVSSM